VSLKPLDTRRPVVEPVSDRGGRGIQLIALHFYREGLAKH
jgi:hypothetical protein